MYNRSILSQRMCSMNGSFLPLNLLTFSTEVSVQCSWALKLRSCTGSTVCFQEDSSDDFTRNGLHWEWSQVWGKAEKQCDKICPCSCRNANKRQTHGCRMEHARLV